MTEFELSAERMGDALRLRAEGEMDLAVTDSLLERVAKARGSATRVLLDLSALSFMDSSGLRALLRLDAQARAEGYQFVVVAPSRAVRNVLEITRADNRLNVVNDPRES